MGIIATILIALYLYVPLVFWLLVGATAFVVFVVTAIAIDKIVNPPSRMKRKTKK